MSIMASFRYTQELLTRLVRPKYYVRVEERVYLSDENDPGRRVIIPDMPRCGSAGMAGRSAAVGAKAVRRPSPSRS